MNKKYFDGLPWKNADGRGEIARKLFADELNFKDVHVFTNLSKAEVIEKMNWLKEKANVFEAEKQGDETLAVGIAWIGHKLLADYEPHKKIIAMHGVSLPIGGVDGSDYYPQYELTIFG